MRKTLVAMSSILAVLLLLAVFAGSGAAANSVGVVGGDALAISITTNPSGATAVYRLTGDTIITPGTFPKIHSGTQYWGVPTQIVITKAGYYPYYINVNARDFNTGNGYLNYDITLTPDTPTTGTLSLTSNPNGATIYIDGVRYGVTPMTLNLPAGTHGVTMQMSGYDSWTTTVKVVGGASSTVTGNLNKIVSTGYLSISSSPSGATIFIDGTYRGTTPKNMNLNEGNHTVRLTASGYAEYSTTVYVQGGKTSVISASMSPSVEYGYVSLKATPAGAAIYVDGVYQNNVPSVSGITLGPFTTGTSHTLLLTASGYQSGSSVFVLSPGETKTITMSLTQEQAKKATLYITSSPANAAIYIDNVYYGMTPATIPELEPGSHVLKLQAANYNEWQEAVTLTAGQTLEKSVSMSPGAAPTVPPKSPAPVFGLIAGLGAAAVLLLRRK